MIKEITKAYTINFRDTGQRTTFIEFIDENGHSGRLQGPTDAIGEHMLAILIRASREGVKVVEDPWGW
jgi:hypothetical protein